LPRGRIAGVIAAAALGSAVACASLAGATDIGSLQAKVAGARDEAGKVAEQLRSAQEEMSAARAHASEAAAREERLSGLLAEGEERAAELAGKVERSERRLVEERQRLRRARRVLARRLVSIYESGAPSEASVLLSSSSYEELATRGDYLARIQEFDSALADRVAQVRDQVRTELGRVQGLKEAAEAYDARLAAARSEVSAVRGQAEAAAASLQSVAASRSSSLATLKARIGGWVSDIEEAEAASRAAAEEEVGRWLGGPFSIPTYVVMCESGGNYGAVNPSSGAGGAYQILPSTWRLYGGQGLPQEASKEEQDRIAAEIWADSGGGAWACAG
jgi:septal ring factor EnvC (AmiA/AmiB activator)